MIWQTKVQQYSEEFERLFFPLVGGSEFHTLHRMFLFILSLMRGCVKNGSALVGAAWPHS